ncbi:hypothetical protein ACQ86N_41875 [Puia sp. P3]|uniref:hypothetical protein n=1 Tax=Puia sp. P3 TaxID=3423952 RepID=UPI003D6754A4
MWERFAYYLLAGILFLYLIGDKSGGGKGLQEKNAADVTGTFLALIWLPLFVGGMIADRYLGYIKSIFIGGGLAGAGLSGTYAARRYGHVRLSRPDHLRQRIFQTQYQHPFGEHI